MPTFLERKHLVLESKIESLQIVWLFRTKYFTCEENVCGNWQSPVNVKQKVFHK